MALESSTYINGLVASNPTSSDNIGDGDNHIRLLKSTIKLTFPALTGAVTGTHTAINSAVSLANAGTNVNTASTLVKRDGSGNFAAGTITAALTGDVTGNASTSSKWATARTITLAGDLSGSASIIGDANVSITAAVADDSHNHVMGNVDGLSAALAGKVDDGQVLTNVPSGALFTDTNTTYSVGNGGLTQINFTSGLNSKLAGIASGAQINPSTAQIVAAAAGCAAGSVDGYSISTSQSGSNANTIYFRT
jgi:hypothetical protein